VATGLAGIGRINFAECSASFSRFTEQHTKETRPGRVTDGFSQTRVMEHPVDLQVFNRNQTELVNNLAAVLVRKISSTPTNPLMHPGDYFTFSFAFRCTLFSFGKFALGFGKFFFFLSKEARVFNLLPVTESGKGFQANINANLTGVRRQNVRFNPLTAKTDIPLAGTATSESDGLGFTSQGPVQLNLDMPNLANNQNVAFQLTAGGGLREGYRVVTPKPLKPGITRLFTGFKPAEEGLHGKVKSNRYILQDLGMNVTERRPREFKSREFGLLVIQTRGFACLLKTGFALIKPMVVNPTAIFKLLIKQGFLPSGRPYSVFERLSHKNIISSFYVKLHTLLKCSLV
jgi:hypothetical protein